MVSYTGVNRIMTSPDGVNWTLRTNPAGANWREVVYGNGQFVAVPDWNNGANGVMTSPDGVNNVAIPISLHQRQQPRDLELADSLGVGGLSVYLAPEGASRRALDSLAHGKPVLVSRPSSLAGIVERTGCGLVFDPTVDDLHSAIRQLSDAYDQYQPHCHRVVRDHFCSSIFRERYHELYETMS
jgi:hypothetical protein